MRVDVSPTQLHSYGLTMANVQSMLSLQNSQLARGQISNGFTTADIVDNGQIFNAALYKPLIVGYHNGVAVHLSDIAQVTNAATNVRNAGYLNYDPSVTVHIFRQPGANIIETNKRIRAQLPFLKAVIPQGIRHDRRSRPHHHHPRVTQGRPAFADDLRSAGDPGGFRFSAQRARHADSQRRRAGLADRHLLGDVSARL